MFNRSRLHERAKIPKYFVLTQNLIKMDEKSFLSYVKKIIHSLIVSTPERMTVERLKRDYANEEGSVIPFCRLGFKDIESFLCSISDTVVINGHGPMAEVLARTRQKTAHIQNLVQRQKKPTSKARSQRNKPKFWCTSQRSNIVFVNEQPKRSLSNNNNNYNKSHHYNTSNYNNNYNNLNKSNNNNDSFNNRHNNHNSEQYTSQATATSSSWITKSFSKLTIDDDQNSNQSPVDLPDKQSDNEAITISFQPDFKDSYIEYVSSDEGCDEDAIPAYAVDERILNYKYKKESPGNNFENEVVPQTEIKCEEPQVQYLSSDEGSDTDAIPAYAVDERVMSVEYPKDVVRFDQQLPKRYINDKLKLLDRIEVQLVTVASPHSFYFWIHDEEYEEYRSMSTQMQRFYDNIHEINYTLPLFLTMPGHLGALHFRGTVWQRAKVLNIKTGNRKNIEVELVDMGERLWICHSDLKYLKTEFATLPPQCWPGRLACVKPRQGISFSVEASNYFYDLVCYRRLFAKVEKINDDDNTVYMVLVDPDTESLTKNINVALIESGWVRRSYKP